MQNDHNITSMKILRIATLTGIMEFYDVLTFHSRSMITPENETFSLSTTANRSIYWMKLIFPEISVLIVQLTYTDECFKCSLSDMMNG